METSLRSEGGGGPVAHPRAAPALSRRAGVDRRRMWRRPPEERAGPGLPALYKARWSLGSGPAPLSTS